MEKQPKIVKLAIGKGHTLPQGKEAWERSYYEITVETTEENIQATKDWAETLIDAWLKPTPATVTPAATKQTTDPSKSLLDKIKEATPAHIAENLSFELKDKYVILRGKKMLPSEDFRQLLDIVKSLGGEYISAGSNSHFKISADIFAKEPSVGDLDPDKLAKLPWRIYKGEGSAGEGEAGWIFSNAKGAESLAAVIRDHGKDTPVTIGHVIYECKFSGEADRFISRAPQKK